MSEFTLSPAAIPSQVSDRRGALDTTALAVISIGTLSYLFFGVLALVSPHAVFVLTSNNSSVTPGVTAFVHLFFARNIPIGLVPFALMATGQRRALGYTALGMAGMQALDFFWSIGSTSLFAISGSSTLTIGFALAGWYLVRHSGDSRTVA